MYGNHHYSSEAKDQKRLQHDDRKREVAAVGGLLELEAGTK